MTNAHNPLKTESPSDGSETQITLSLTEQAVLGVFRKYLMSPGKMLCFSNADLQSYRGSLASLSHKGLLVKENFGGGYAL
ncbi:MAG: hypothetical protein ACYC6Y_06270, partial [Thermoguttaceae bacterium]